MAAATLSQGEVCKAILLATAIATFTAMWDFRGHAAFSQVVADLHGQVKDFFSDLSQHARADGQTRSDGIFAASRPSGLRP